MDMRTELGFGVGTVTPAVTRGGGGATTESAASRTTATGRARAEDRLP
jgi:hypothetical protein